MRAAGSRPSIRAAVAEVRAMPPADLRAAWEQRHGSPPPALPPSLLARDLAYAIQARRHGGLDQRTARRLHSLANDAAPGVQPGCTASVTARPGTQYLREWGGRTHRVLVGEDGGYDYEGQRFASLSAVARHITGAHWSGPRFFGVRR